MVKCRVCIGFHYGALHCTQLFCIFEFIIFELPTTWIDFFSFIYPSWLCLVFFFFFFWRGGTVPYHFHRSNWQISVFVFLLRLTEIRLKTKTKKYIQRKLDTSFYIETGLNPKTSFVVQYCFCTVVQCRSYMILFLPDWSHDARFFSYGLSICKNLPFVTQCIIERIMLYNTSLSDHMNERESVVTKKNQTKNMCKLQTCLEFDELNHCSFKLEHKMFCI